MAALVFLDANTHQQLKHHHQARYQVNLQRHCLPVVLSEFVEAAASLPLVFIKDADSGIFRSCVLTGLVPGQNLCTDGENWLGYEPKVMWHQPLMAVAQRKGGYAIAVEHPHLQLSETQGQALFAGQHATPYLQQLSQFAIQWQTDTEQTQAFIKTLLQLSLLEPQTLTVQGPQGPFEVKGCYVINSRQLAALPDADFLSLRQQGYLAAIYAAQASLGQVDVLIARFQARG
jgi:hypothetical protein